MKDIAAYYTATSSSNVDKFQVPTQLSDYISFFYSELSKTKFETSSDYWKEQFKADIEPFELPLDNNRLNDRTFDAGYCSLMLEPSVVQAIKGKSAEVGVSVFIMYFAAFNLLLNKLSNQSSVVVGVPIAGQAFTKMFDVVGQCVSMLPIYSEIVGDDSIEDFVRALKKTLKKGYTNYYCSYGSIVKKCKILRKNSRVPLTSNSFTFTKKLEPRELNFSDLEVDYHWNPRKFDNFDLKIDVQESLTAFELRCYFNRHLFRSETIKNRLYEFVETLRFVACEENKKIKDIDCIPEQQKEELASINDAGSEISCELMHELFGNTVKQEANSVAIKLAQKSLTFHE